MPDASLSPGHDRPIPLVELPNFSAKAMLIVDVLPTAGAYTGRIVSFGRLRPIANSKGAVTCFVFLRYVYAANKIAASVAPQLSLFLAVRVPVP